MKRALVLAVALAACRPQFITIDEACRDHVPGENGALSISVEAIQRMNCYRRLARMAQGSMDERINQASLRHALYVEENGVPTTADVFVEDPSKQGFTGEFPVDRMSAMGYPIDDTWTESLGYWEAVWQRTEGVSPAELVDEWMSHYHARQAILQPGWKDAGYAESPNWVVYDNLYGFPADVHQVHPVLYPADGQIGVPTSYTMPFDGDPVPVGETVGYPVTVTVGSDEAESDFTGKNHYALVLIDGRMRVAGGSEVEVYTVAPESTPYDFPATVAIVPKEPLQPNTTYEMLAEVTWNANHKVLEWSFTTGTGALPASRSGAPQPSYVLHKPPGMWAGYTVLLPEE